MLNVLEMLSPVRKKKTLNLEGLADKLIAGEKIPPEVVHDQIVSAGIEPADLQAIIDRRQRVAELAAAVKRASKAPARLAQIDAEIAAAEQSVKDAQAKYDAVHERHSRERLALKTLVTSAEMARSDLLLKGNLSPTQWERIQEAERAADDADEAYHSALRHEQGLRKRANELAQVARNAQGTKSVCVDGEWIDGDTATALAKRAEREHADHVAGYSRLKAEWDEAVIARQRISDAILNEQLA